ncbi:MAG: 3-oxoacyl-ACP synthase III [Planctomycetaceae bacterium]|nr:3-oxoacyl-ACP synthase III [Planctomycetaceae bacterium]
MRYQHVCVEAFGYSLPPHVVTSAQIESRLAPVYERFHLPAGRLELMTGIRERRFWDRGILPGTISAESAEGALAASGLDRRHIGCLIHGSVCRDQLEPATASGVHHALKLPNAALVFDLSNACLGLLDGMVLLANMIELGQVRAGLVVGTEMGRDLVEGTIDTLLAAPDLTKQDVKLAFASLTIGSGSAAVVLCDRKLSRTGRRLLGGAWQADTSSHQLCAGGVTGQNDSDDRPRMQTDSEALLHAGVALAESTWTQTKQALHWDNASVSRSFTHQVGRAHRKLLYDRIGLDPAIDFSTVEFLGNTGAAALPLTVALGIERGFVKPGDRVALLGIGSGLNALMLGLDWAT